MERLSQSDGVAHSSLGRSIYHGIGGWPAAEWPAGRQSDLVNSAVGQLLINHLNVTGKTRLL
jgi:hypothetical protein